MLPDSFGCSIVIVNYLAYDALADCLASLAAFVRSTEVVVVDHATQAAACDRLMKQFPWARFISVKTNPGFAAGVNRGVRETNGEYILFLNPDCIVDGDVVRPLASWMARNPNAGACGAIVREPDGSLQASARRFPGVSTGFAGRTSWLTRLWPGNPLTTRNLVRRHVPAEPVAVDWVSGACMMVRRKAFEAVGGMDEQFFLYWEDADLCLRLRQAGWQTFYSPAASVIHVTGQSSRQAPRASLVAFHRSAYRYYRKHGGTLAVIFRPWVYLGLQARLALKLLLVGIGPRKP